MSCVRRRLVLSLPFFLAAGPALAGPPLPALTGPVLLTVTGLDKATFPQGQVELDQGRLESIGLHALETSSIWTEGVHRYEGVLLQNLLQALQADATTLRLHALNDYQVEMPAGEATSEAPLLSFRVDGELLSVRDKGPIWLIYPFDDHVDYRTDTIFARSVWQLDRIEVLR